MTTPIQTPRAERLTQVILGVFRTNGCLLASGDELVGDLGLTSARWQVLGAISAADGTLPVAHIARNMGLTRQAVQRVVDDLRTAGLVALQPNPHHRTARLVTLTRAGSEAYAQASERQVRWAQQLAEDLPEDDLSAACRVLDALQQKLSSSA